MNKLVGGWAKKKIINLFIYNQIYDTHVVAIRIFMFCIAQFGYPFCPFYVFYSNKNVILSLVVSNTIEKKKKTEAHVLCNFLL